MTEKLAACLNCRRGKMKCLTNTAGDSPDCVGCVHRGVHCVRPAYHVGRNPGSRNKLSGLQKAICQIEQAMYNEDSSSRRDRELLKKFLEKIASERLATPASRTPVEPVEPQGHACREQRVQWPRISTKTSPRDAEAISAAESPLLLIAQAPEELSMETKFCLPPGSRSQAAVSSYEAFFGPFQPTLDTQPDLDPVELGLVDMAEAERLFSFFFQNLSEMRWGLDPAIHSSRFVHRRSLFLFTSILAASALFLPSASALSRRLRLHCRKMADVIVSRRMRSVEIILAFMVNVPWLMPGTHWADDETWMYLSAASTIALDLSLDKMILHPGTDKAVLEWSRTHQVECIDAQKVLDMDGFPDVDVTSAWGRRLLRRRERTWLTLWGLERGVCLARGRRWSVPVTPMIDFCDNWHLSDIAAPWDDSISPAMVLRRDLLPLIEKLKANVLCKVAEEPAIESTMKPHQEIELYFQNWSKTCPCTTMALNGENKLPPYMDILSSHTRLSAYAHLINLPTTSAAIRKQFRAAAFTAALSVLRTAVQRESELMAIPNNSVIMIAFSAVFAIQITSAPAGSSERGGPASLTLLTSTVLPLIRQVGQVLERIGSVTPHRNGISALFTVHIRRILQLASSSRTMAAAEAGKSGDEATQPVTDKDNDVQQLDPTTTITTTNTIAITTDIPNQQQQQPVVDFSNISIDQITDMIDAMGDGLEAYGCWGFDMDSFPDPNFLDWDQFS